MATSDEENPELHQTGQCACGRVKYLADGTIVLNCLCHCRACGRGRGMTPVHLIGFKGDFKILEGEDLVTTRPISGKLTHTFCSHCGGGMYQQPQGATFYAVFPSTFQIEAPSETDGACPSSFLSKDLQPKVHINYENRLTNYYDTLPKFKTFPGSAKMTSEGEIMEET